MNEPLTQEELVTIENRFCTTYECYHYSLRGYIYCERCLHGTPNKMTKEHIKLKKQWDKKRKIRNLNSE